MKIGNDVIIQGSATIEKLPVSNNSLSAIVQNDGNLFKRELGTIVTETKESYIPGLSVSFPSLFNLNTEGLDYNNRSLVVSFANQQQGMALMAPVSMNGTPAFRRIVKSDLSDANVIFTDDPRISTWNTVYTSSLGITKVGNDFRPNYGTTANTIAQGNDVRINNGQTAFGWGNHAGKYLNLGNNAIFINKSIGTDLNNQKDSVVYAQTGALNKPENNNSTVVSFNGLYDYGFQIASRSSKFWFRNQEAGIWQSWKTLWHSDNLTKLSQLTNDLDYSSFVPYTGATSNVNLGTRSITSTGGFIGNASTATTLATARTINGTSFNGSANITTANWGTSRNITIGNTTKSVNGSGNVAWSLAEIGASALSHTHAIGDITGLQTELNKIGNLPSLTTTDKSNLVNAINEVNGNIPNINDFGGVNLVDDSHFYNGNENGWSNIYGTQVVENHIYKKTFTSLSNAARIERVFTNLKAGVYTLTIFVKTPVNIEWSGFVNGYHITGISPSSPTEFYRRYVTFTVNTDGNVTVRGYVRNIPVGSVIEIDWFKLETGYVGSDWTPSPEDQVSDWNETDSTKYSFIKNKPTIPTSSDYITTNTNQTGLSGDKTSSGIWTLGEIRKTGQNDTQMLLAGGGHRPVSDFALASQLPTVNNGALTLSTGTGLSGSASFTANQSGNSSFSVGIASTHKLPTVAEWNALPTTNTITRLRGTTTGTYTSGDLTLINGAGIGVTQSGANFTITNTSPNIIQTLSVGTRKGQFSISGGNSIKLDGLALVDLTYNILDFFNSEANISTNNGLKVFRTTVGATGVPTEYGGGILFQRNSLGTGGNTLLGSFALFKSHERNEDKLYLSTGTGSTTMSDWRVVATEDWVATQNFSTQTLTAGTNISIVGNVISATDTNTTYASGTNTLLSAGTDTTMRVWSASTLGQLSYRATSGQTNSVLINDTRNVDDIPSTTYRKGVFFDFKTSTAIGLTGMSTYSGVMTMVPYTDASGWDKSSWRIAQSAGKLQFQHFGNTAWQPWNEIYHTGNLNPSDYALASALSGYVPTSRTLTAGNGLSGGGNLTANRTITLGTPTAITLSSTNSVTTSSHTHAFTPGGTTAQYIRGDGTLATLPTFTDAITTISRNGVNIPIVSQNVDIPVFSTTGAGLVPARVGSVATKYLREDGTWVTPTNTTYSTGAIAELNSGTIATGRLWGSNVLNSWLNGKGFITSVPTMTATVEGTAKLFSATVQSVASTAVSATASRTYGIQKNSSGQLVVNVPWTNSTYSLISLSEITNPNSVETRLISGQRLDQWATDRGFNSGIFEYSTQGGIQTMDWNSYALGDKSIAIGSVTTANGFAQVAIGTQIYNKGVGSISTGFIINDEGTYNTLNGAYLFNRGDNAVLSGLGLKNYQSGHIVTGQYNDFETTNYDVSLSLSKPEAVPLFTLGNGTSDLTRSNAFRIYREGSMELYGRGFYRDDKRDPSWFTKSNTLADVQYVNEAIASSGSSYTLPIATTSIRGGLRTTTGTTAGYDINASTGIMTMRYASSTQKGMIRVGNGLVIDINGILSTTGGGGGGYVDPIAEVGIQNSKVNTANISWSETLSNNLLGSGEILSNVSIERTNQNTAVNLEYEIVAHDNGVWRPWADILADEGYPGKMDMVPTIFGIVISSGSVVYHDILLKGWVYNMPFSFASKDIYAYINANNSTIEYEDKSLSGIDRINKKMIGFFPDINTKDSFYFNPWMN